MGKPLRRGEIRIVIKSADASAETARLIPASVLQKTFSRVLRALKSADSALHGPRKKHRSQFYISDLAMSSNIVEMCERTSSVHSAIELFRHVSAAVYRSEFDRAAEHGALAKDIVALGRGVDPAYPAVALFESDEIPFDSFFARQADRFGKAMSPDALKSRFHIGSVLTTFDGTLKTIDYRGATWIGHLVLPGGGVQIECVFDKERGEDFYNPHGNKRVTIHGRAIYTGDSPLPERIEVFDVEDVPSAEQPVDIRGSLKGKRYFGADDLGNTYLQ